MGGWRNGGWVEEWWMSEGVVNEWWQRGGVVALTLFEDHHGGVANLFHPHHVTSARLFRGGWSLRVDECGGE